MGQIRDEFKLRQNFYRNSFRFSITAVQVLLVVACVIVGAIALVIYDEPTQTFYATSSVGTIKLSSFQTVSTAESVAKKETKQEEAIRARRKESKSK